MTHRIWLRVKLPEEDVAACARIFKLRIPSRRCDGPQLLAQCDSVFTEEPILTIVQRMTSLQWPTSPAAA
jgi:hypothetical protein